ncbi:MAG: CAP domain-containing protein [Flammeovirgaceae bacterium]
MKKLMCYLCFVWVLYLCSSVMTYLPTDQEGEEVAVCLSEEEQKLYQLITDYRKSKGLDSIPLSRSLTYVAQAHVKDLEINTPITNRCNMHSWSNDGDWTACCYTGDHAQAKCMWNKPKELTNYTGYGFEISYGGFGAYEANATDALQQWKGSSGHNAVIINQGIWKSSKWQAVGVGIFGSYGVVWFGKVKDTTSTPAICLK